MARRQPSALEELAFKVIFKIQFLILRYYRFTNSYNKYYRENPCTLCPISPNDNIWQNYSTKITPGY